MGQGVFQGSILFLVTFFCLIFPLHISENCLVEMISYEKDTKKIASVKVDCQGMSAIRSTNSGNTVISADSLLDSFHYALSSQLFANELFLILTTT